MWGVNTGYAAPPSNRRGGFFSGFGGKAFQKYQRAAIISVRNVFMYPGEFFAPAITYSLFVFVFIQLYGAALEPGQTIVGYDRTMLAYYFMVAELVLFGFGRMFSTLSEEVKTGQIAYALARPYDFIGYQRSVLLGPVVLQTGYFALVGLGILLLSVGPPGPIGFAQAGFLILSLSLSALLSFYFQMSLALTAFWFEENSAFFWMYQKLGLVIGTLMPIEFLPDWLLTIALVTPFPYLGYAPARIAVAFDPDQAGRLVLGQLGWLIGAVLLSRLLFRLGRRNLVLNGG